MERSTEVSLAAVAKFHAHLRTFREEGDKTKKEDSTEVRRQRQTTQSHSRSRATEWSKAKERKPWQSAEQLLNWIDFTLVRLLTNRFLSDREAKEICRDLDKPIKE